MPDDVDLLTPAQDALFRALKPIEELAAAGGEGVPTGLRVFQHVPENTKVPYILISTMDASDASSGDEQASEILAEIVCEWIGSRRRELLWMLWQIKRHLNGKPIADNGAVFTRPRFVREVAPETIADGVTYVGLSYFTFIAQPA
jgi:hypothetical protein